SSAPCRELRRGSGPPPAPTRLGLAVPCLRALLLLAGEQVHVGEGEEVVDGEAVGGEDGEPGAGGDRMPRLSAAAEQGAKAHGQLLGLGDAALRGEHRELVAAL